VATVEPTASVAARRGAVEVELLAGMARRCQGGQLFDGDNVGQLVENIKQDPIFEEPQLANLSQISTAPVVYTFDMTFHFTYAPKTPGTTAATDKAPGAPATSSSGVPGGRAKG